MRYILIRNIKKLIMKGKILIYCIILSKTFQLMGFSNYFINVTTFFRKHLTKIIDLLIPFSYIKKISDYRDYYFLHD